MTAADGRETRDLLDLIEGRDRISCPVCRATHCLTVAGRLWTHGPRGRRCRGSARIPEGARAAARDIRGGAR